MGGDDSAGVRRYSHKDNMWIQPLQQPKESKEVVISTTQTVLSHKGVRTNMPREEVLQGSGKPAASERQEID